jgi:hypothetical protein
LTLRPSVADGRVLVTAVSANLLGQALASDRLANLTRGLNERAQHAYPLDLRATSVRVDAAGLHIQLTAGPGPLQRT